MSAAEKDKLERNLRKTLLTLFEAGVTPEFTNHPEDQFLC